MAVKEFQKTIWDFYRKNGRKLPWRETKDPYKILVSEIMLQQTQVVRVLPKYEEFIKTFPDFFVLSQASLSSILRIWSGLGYNRRALYLQKIARLIEIEHKGKFPQDPKILEQFPGIGTATARSIVVFSFNVPYAFIETNIRRVFIHRFFEGQTDVGDKELYPFIRQTLDQKNPRQWYYALMDYGSYLAKQVENPNQKSKHYTKQSKFKGSLRQTRGNILKIISKEKRVFYNKLFSEFQDKEDLFKKALAQLEREGFLQITKRIIKLR